MDKIPVRLRDATDPHMSNIVTGLALNVLSCVPTQKGLSALRSMCHKQRSAFPSEENDVST